MDIALILSLPQANAERDRKRSRVERIPKPSPLECPNHRCHIVRYEQESGSLAGGKTVFRESLVDIDDARDQHRPTDVVDDRDARVSVGSVYLVCVSSVHVPFPESGFETGGVEDEIQAYPDHRGNRRQRDTSLSIINRQPRKQVFRHRAGAINSTIPAEQDPNRHTCNAGSRAVPQELQGADG